MNISDLVRPNILKLKPYSSGKSEFSGDAQIFLDTNENPFGDNIINRYPDPLQEKLVSRLVEIKSEQFGVSLDVDHFALGNGSDEFIDQFVRIFCEPVKDSLAFCPPTFGMYQVAADVNDVRSVTIPLDRAYDLDVKSLLGINGKAKLLFLCSPNNPTGNCVSTERLKSVIAAWQGIVVLDEAYVDFCPQNSLVPIVKKFPNLAILQTLSKAWGMAGVRLGMCIANPEIIHLLRKVKMPYNIGSLKERFVLDRLADLESFANETAMILSERKRLQKELSKYATEIFPSDANFLLVRFTNAQAVYEHLVEHGVIVRNFSNKASLENCLRITVGTPRENDILLTLLSERA